MRDRYRLYCRKRTGTYYIQDNVTGQQESTGTKDKKKARAILFAKNQANEQPALNLAMARTYLSAHSPQLATRTWQDIMDDKEKNYESLGQLPALKRWRKACNSEPFRLIAPLRLIETESAHILAVLRHKKAGPSTNTWLRILHNYALDMGWLLAPALAKKAWPRVRYREKRGITHEEHQRILSDAGGDLEWVCYLQLLWETGGAQSDIAQLTHERLDWEQEILLYRRAKTKNCGYEYAKIRIGKTMRSILMKLPEKGFLFPNLATIHVENRSRRFRRSCLRLGIKGVTLHSYRYAWAERARSADMPLRAAMEALGHQSRAVHQAYAKNAQVDAMPLEYYERKKAEKIIDLEKYRNGISESANKFG